jgi:hypothetical protein
MHGATEKRKTNYLSRRLETSPSAVFLLPPKYLTYLTSRSVMHVMNLSLKFAPRGAKIHPAACYGAKPDIQPTQGMRRHAPTLSRDTRALAISLDKKISCQVLHRGLASWPTDMRQRMAACSRNVSTAVVPGYSLIERPLGDGVLFAGARCGEPTRDLLLVRWKFEDEAFLLCVVRADLSIRGDPAVRR